MRVHPVFDKIHTFITFKTIVQITHVFHDII